MGIFVLALIALVGLAAGVLLLNRHLKKHVPALTKIGGELDGATIHRRAGVSGKRDGLAVSYKFVDRSLQGDLPEPWTVIEVDLPPEYPLVLRIVAGVPEERALAEGRAVDLLVGDPEFDLRFIVEAAPSDVVKHLIDANACGLLRRFARPELETTHTGKPTLRLSVSGWHDQTADAMRLIDEVARIARRVRDAYAAADTAVPQGETGAPYRATVDQKPLLDAEARRAKEIEQVESIRRKRTEAALIMKVIIGIVVLAGGLIVVKILVVR